MHPQQQLENVTNVTFRSVADGGGGDSDDVKK